jgi:hypothetical protein
MPQRSMVRSLRTKLKTYLEEKVPLTEMLKSIINQQYQAFLK